MVEICVAVNDATRVPALMRRLAGLFDRSAISFDSSRKQVLVTSEWESRGVMQVVEAVDAWLTEEGGGSAMLTLGSRSYEMNGVTAIRASR
jgi:hypothetical protein